MELNEYAYSAMQTAIYPGAGTPMGLAYVALKMNGEAGEFAEHLGKAMRDDNFIGYGMLDKERHALMVKEVGDVLWYLAAACRELGVTLQDVAQINLAKLADRQTRQALNGAGDNR